MALRIPAFFSWAPLPVTLQMSPVGLMLYLCIFYTQNLCGSSQIGNGGLGNGGCGHSIITPLCCSLLLTVCPSWTWLCPGQGSSWTSLTDVTPCCQHLVTDTPHLNTSSLFSCSTSKVLQCWLPHFKPHICLQSINNLI